MRSTECLSPTPKLNLSLPNRITLGSLNPQPPFAGNRLSASPAEVSLWLDLLALKSAQSAPEIR